MAATATYAVMVAAWVSFVVDYAVRLFLAYDRRRWFVRNLLDLAIIAWPLFLPLRLFRLLLLITVIEKAVRRTVRGRVALYTAFSVVLLVYVCALSILQVERSQPDTTIKNFGDALWWSLETVTTVGYGDTAPHTGTGKWIAATLMIGGIGIVSVITASLASWILQRAALEGDGHNAATEAHIDAVRADVKQQIDALRADVQTLIDSLKGTADTAATMDDRASNRDVMRQ